MLFMFKVRDGRWWELLMLNQNLNKNFLIFPNQMFQTLHNILHKIHEVSKLNLEKYFLRFIYDSKKRLRILLL